MTVRWLKSAVLQLDSLGASSHYEDAIAACSSLNWLMQVVAGLERDSRSGRPGWVEGTRVFLVPRLPYVVTYRVSDSDVHILKVCTFKRRRAS